MHVIRDYMDYTQRTNDLPPMPWLSTATDLDRQRSTGRTAIESLRLSC